MKPVIWPHWHTFIFSNDTKIDMMFVCPKDVKKMVVQRLAPTKSGSLAKECEGELH